MCIMIPHSKYTVLNQNKSFGLNVIENKFQMFSFFFLSNTLLVQPRSSKFEGALNN